MSEQKGCGCCGGTNLIFACSGAADVGAVADQAARKLSGEGKGKMFCMAGIGGRVPFIMETTDAADSITAIDGCPMNCVKNSLEQAGFSKYTHIQLADLGLNKGSSPVNDENIQTVCDAVSKSFCQK